MFYPLEIHIRAKLDLYKYPHAKKISLKHVFKKQDDNLFFFSVTLPEQTSDPTITPTLHTPSINTFDFNEQRERDFTML